MQVSTSTQIGVCVLVIISAIVFAIWPRSDGGVGTGAAGRQPSSSQAADAQALRDLARLRARAQLLPCPAAGLAATPSSPLAGVTVDCLAGGPAVDVAGAGGGRPMLINYWAYWCAPCRTELPVVADYARRAGDQVRVLTMHGVDGAQQPDMSLTLLTDIGVRLPTVVDTKGSFAAAVGLPRAYPTTVLIRADGTVAALLPRVFRSTGEIAQAVRQYLLVTT